MSNSNLDLNTVITLVEDFNQKHRAPIETDIKSLDQQIEALKGKSADRTYDMVAELVALAIALEVEAPTAGYESFLVSRGIRKPSNGHNPYMAFIKAVFISQVGGSYVWEDSDRSYEKHANHVRFLVGETHQGRITTTVQDYIRAYPSKLKGIEEQDRKDNPNTAQAKRVQTTINKGVKAAPMATLAVTLGGKENDLLKVWGRIRDGQFEVMNVDVANDDYDTLYYKLGLSQS